MSKPLVLVAALGVATALASCGEASHAPPATPATAGSTCSPDLLGSATATSTVSASDGSPLPEIQAIKEIPASRTDAAGAPVTTVSQCSAASLSVLMNYPRQAPLTVTFNPVDEEMSIRALNGSGLLIATDRRSSSNGDGGTSIDDRGWKVGFAAATTGAYEWSVPAQWVGPDVVIHRGEINFSVVVEQQQDR